MTAKADAVEGGGLGEPPPPAAAGDGDPRRRTGTALAIGGRGEEEEEEEAPSLRPLGRAIAICFVLSCLCLSLPPVRGYNILSYSSSSKYVVPWGVGGAAEGAAEAPRPRYPGEPAGGGKEHLPLSGSPRLGVRAAPKEALPYHTTLASYLRLAFVERFSFCSYHWAIQNLEMPEKSGEDVSKFRFRTGNASGHLSVMCFGS